MSNEKVKVKELATDLGLQSKDVLAVARELEIASAKAAGSNLSEEEAARIRTHISGGDAPEKQDVIVRRRKKSPAKASTVEGETPETSADGETAEVTSAATEVAPEAATVVVTQESEEVVAPVVEEKAVAAKVVEPAAKIVTPAAKIVSPAPAPAPQSEEVQPEKVEKVDKVEATEVAESVSAAKSKQAEASEEKAAVEAAPKTDEKAPPAPARVVSPAEFSAEPERDAEGALVSSAPALPAKSEDGEADKDESSGTQVRVISRPDPAQRTERSATDNRQPRGAQGARDGRDGGGRDFRGGRPGAPGSAGGFGAPGGQNRQPRDAQGGRQNFGGGAGAPGAGVPGGAGGQPAADGRGKKRSKGRRTVDFSSTRRNEQEGSWSKASGRRKGRGKQVEAPKGGTQPQKAVKRKIKVEEFIRVSDLAHQMALKAGEIIKVLFNLGVMATINQSLDVETATLVAMEFGYEIEKVGFSEEEIIEAQHQPDDPANLLPRPPVVTIMGHVDHGKTSLLDALRKSSVVSGEAGGITQHIGAYHVKTKKGEIVFLDTPGHEAFTAMRARGAEVTDIVVLVVAADDGVMEQTREAINHAKEAGVPIMVAVNKMDKPAADPERVKRELSENGIVAEEWGGDTVFSYVSAKSGEGLEELLDLLVLQADLLELKANPDKGAIGRIIEAKLDKGRGSLATVLIQQGTLKQGDCFVCGIHAGRVRAMLNDQGKSVKQATPSMPVVVQGFEGVPEAGEEFVCVADERTARRIAETRAIKQRERELARESKVTLETFLASRASDVEAAVLKLVIKADVQGTLEAVIDAVTKLSTEKVKVQVVHGGAGAISESDILLATAANGIAIGFNVRPSVKAKELAELEKVEIRFYDVIYKLVEEIQSAMEGLLAPVEREVVLGTVEVRETFSVPKVGTVAGCHVIDGKITRNASVRLLRDGVVIHTGKIASLRRFKDDVREVLKGYECGVGIDGYNDIKVGDNIEAFEIVEEAAKL